MRCLNLVTRPKLDEFLVQIKVRNFSVIKIFTNARYLNLVTFPVLYEFLVQTVVRVFTIIKMLCI